MKSFKTMYAEDKKYQEMIATYFTGVDTIKKALQYHVVSGNDASAIGRKLYTDLETSLNQYNLDKKTEVQNVMKQLVQENKQILDYTTDRAKNLQIEYQLMSKDEIEDMVNHFALAKQRELRGVSAGYETAQEPATKDLLEINLFRLELQKRGFDEMEQKVKRYIMENKLESAHENDERYQAAKTENGVLNSMGTRGIIVLDDYIPTDSLPAKIEKMVRETVAAAGDVPTDLDSLMKRIPQTNKLTQDLAAL